jgi:S1-C subfamily serine protease
MRSKFHLVILALLVFVLAACGTNTAAVEVPEAPEPVAIDDVETETISGPFSIRVRIPDVSEDAEIGTEGLDELVVENILPNYPEVFFVGVDSDAGALIFSFDGQFSPAMCNELFQSFGAVPDCAGPLSIAGEIDGAGITDSDNEVEIRDGAETASFDPEKMAVSVDAALESVVFIRTDYAGATGFFFSEDGYILTNRHVVVGQDSFVVTLFDGLTVPAVLIGHVTEDTAVLGDLAILKIEGDGYPTLEFADSDRLVIGEPLVAIGHPAEYGYWLATSGVYQGSSGINIITTIPGSEGASGAPMLNQDGQVVGLLWGGTTFSSEERPIPTPYDVNVVIWTYDEFQSLVKHETWGVAANESFLLAKAIIAAGANVPAHTATLTSDFSVNEFDLTIESPGIIGPEIIDFLNEYYLADVPGVEVVGISNAAASVIFTFNQVPAQDAIDGVLAMMSEADSGQGANINVNNPEAIYQDFSNHPDGEMALAAAEISLAGVVSIDTDSGSGTGSFITEDGYILTNAHVVDNLLPGGFLQVTLYDGSSYPAILVGYDEDQLPDVGVLKIDITGAPLLPIVDPASLSVGQSVFQIGHPGGYGYWLITGGEVLRIDSNAGEFDNSGASASGNSGGPVINLNGEVVGLLYGRAGGGFTFDYSRQTTEIIDNWSDFWALREQYTSSVDIHVALDVANQIISVNGNVE